jgi:lysophospholipase L1-like esterase
MATVASNMNCAICHFENGWTTSSGDMSTYVYSDGIHPNQAGHTVLFNLLYPIVQSVAATWLSSLGN